MGSGVSVEDEKAFHESRPKKESDGMEEKDRMNIDSAVKKKKSPNITHNEQVSASSSSSGTQAAAAPKDVTSEQLQKMAMGQKGYKDEHRDYNTSLLHQKQDVAWEEAVSSSVTDAVQTKKNDTTPSSSGSKQSAVMHRPLQKPPPRRISNPGITAGGTVPVVNGSGQASRASRIMTNMSQVRPIEGNNPKKQIVYAPSELPAASAPMQSIPPTRMIPNTSPSSSSGTNKIESNKQNTKNTGGSTSVQSKYSLVNPPNQVLSSEISDERERNRINGNASPTPNRIPIIGQGSGVRSHGHNTSASSPSVSATNTGIRTGLDFTGPGPNRYSNSSNIDPNRRLPVRPAVNSLPVSSMNTNKSSSLDNSDVEDDRDVVTPPRPKNIPLLYINSNMSTNMSTAPPTLMPNGRKSISPEPLRINTNISGIGISTAQNTMISTAMSAQNTRGVPNLERDSSKSTSTIGRTTPSSSTRSNHRNGAAGSPTNHRIGTVVNTKPSTPVSNIQYEVKETNDVKRNRVKLPPTMTHAKPTTGDWLKKRYIVNNYILLDTLGTGSYGEVRLCKDRTTDNLFAIKIISKEMLKKRKSGNSNETYFEDIRREIAIMKKLVHPNVLRLFEVLDDPNVNKMYLVLEYMKEGDLINVLKSREISSASSSCGGNNYNSSTPTSTSNISSLSDLELWNIFRQVVAGIRYLHYQNVVHGDIKPQNLLVGENGIVKIADFGISKMLSNSDEQLGLATGTPAFMSPELCAAEASSFSGM